MIDHLPASSRIASGPKGAWGLKLITDFFKAVRTIGQYGANLERVGRAALRSSHLEANDDVRGSGITRFHRQSTRIRESTSDHWAPFMGLNNAAPTKTGLLIPNLLLPADSGTAETSPIKVAIASRRTGALIAPAWAPQSWQSRDAQQQPDWPDSLALNRVLSQIDTLAPLVSPEAIRSLHTSLASVAVGDGFLVQAGDCAESFDDFTVDRTREKLYLISQMAALLACHIGVPIVKVGRIAGQFSKPRSGAFERLGNIMLPSFRGHMVNDVHFNAQARTPDPQRLMQAYLQSARTLNVIREFNKDIKTSPEALTAWAQASVVPTDQGWRFASNPSGKQNDSSVTGVPAAARMGQTVANDGAVYTSHEALLLGYEQALTRQDPLTGRWYDCSAHFLWIGERTRQLDGAHVEFLRGVSNPVGCKIGPSTTPDFVLKLCELINPLKIPGRLTLITRMGADKVEDLLRPILRAVRAARHPVVWVCDPMHGNTFSVLSGRKTRRFEVITEEISGFVRAHKIEGTWPGGIHLEFSADDVTECIGGSMGISSENLDQRYETLCDPRLNRRQSLDLAVHVAEQMSAYS